MAPMTEYQKNLIEALKDPIESAAYLNAALEEGGQGRLPACVAQYCVNKRQHEGRSRESASEQGKCLSHLVSPWEF